MHTRFPEVAELKLVWWFAARGETECWLPAGTYTLSWRILLKENLLNWNLKPATFSLTKNDGEVTERKCFIDPRPRIINSQQQAQDAAGFHLPTVRVVENGWREYDVGEFSVEKGREDSSSRTVLKFSMTAIEGACPKSGVCLDGVVVRPSNAVSKFQPESRESLIRFLTNNSTNYNIRTMLEYL